MSLHPQLSGAELHAPAYFQASDPGAIGAGKMWVDTSGGSGKWIAYFRNTANDGWELAGGAASSTSLNFTLVDEKFEMVCFTNLALNVTPSRDTITDQVIATGNGVQSVFDDGDGSNLGITEEPGSVVIEVVLVNTNTATITDDGEGVLSDPTEDVTGTFNYGDGSWTLTFNGSVPANTEDLLGDCAYYFGATFNARISAFDLIRCVHGGYGPLTYGIITAGGGTPGSFYADSKDAVLTLTCGEVGFHNIDVYIRDGYGNEQFITTNVQLQDNLALCP